MGQIDYFFLTTFFCNFWNFTASVLIHFHSSELSSMNILPKISFCVLLKNESPTDLERHEGEYMITENLTMPERQALTDYKQRHLSWDPGHVSTAQNRKRHSDQLSIYKIRLSLHQSLSSGSPLGCSPAQEAQRVRRQQANFSIQCFQSSAFERQTFNLILQRCNKHGKQSTQRKMLQSSTHPRAA